MKSKDENYIDEIGYAMDIGYVQYLDRKQENLTEQFDCLVTEYLNRNETRLYNCGGLPVELNLPKGEHEKTLLQNGLYNINQTWTWKHRFD